MAIAQWFVPLPALPDVNAEFEQLAMEAGCTPTEVLPAHLVYQISGLTQKDGPSAVAAPYLPGPEQTKAGTMPGYHRYWIDDGQRRAPVTPEVRQVDPQLNFERFLGDL
ncbi:MAG: hypothetical protein WBL50_13960 [Candidatus Acidiferrum sp.]